MRDTRLASTTASTVSSSSTAASSSSSTVASSSSSTAASSSSSTAANSSSSTVASSSSSTAASSASISVASSSSSTVASSLSSTAASSSSSTAASSSSSTAASSSLSTVAVSTSTAVSTSSSSTATSATLTAVASSLSTVITSSALTTLTTTSCNTPTSTILYYNSAPTTYTQQTYTYNASSAGAAVLEFGFTSAGSNKIGYLDDVSIVDTNASNSQILINGGFENGTLVGWQQLCTSNCQTLSGSLTTTSCHTGSFCYTDGCKGGLDFLRQTFTTSIGHIYNLNFWLQVSGDQQVFVRIF